jgi:hypothetical protein
MPNCSCHWLGKHLVQIPSRTHTHKQDPRPHLSSVVYMFTSRREGGEVDANIDQHVDGTRTNGAAVTTGLPT